MAKSIRVSAYSADLLRIAANCDRVIELQLETPEKAQALRFELYGLRRAMQREGAEQGFADFMRAKIKVVGAMLRISPPEAFDPQLSQLVEAALATSAPAAALNPAAGMDAETLPVWTPPPPPVDPYEAYLKTPEAPAAAPAPPVDPFDLTETRGKIDSFTTAVTAWLGGGEAEK